MNLGLTPKEIVAELDKYIIGQREAKKAVAVALRNRYRRKYVSSPLREEIMPKNIIMIGPTGVGKTEIARRLARLAKAPFLKVEASKFTEVGYVGKDVESIIRELVERSINMVKEEEMEKVKKKAEKLAEKRLIDAILNSKKSADIYSKDEPLSKEKVISSLMAGELDEDYVELEISEKKPPFPFIEVSVPNVDDIDMGLRDAFSQLFPPRRAKKKIKVKEARNVLIQEESEKLIDIEAIKREAIRRAENDGIVFIDEIDKIASRGTTHGPDVSREGVQRDLLPIVEGCTVNTKHGQVRTDYILFIASGAFHISKPSDLIPELQGRFPIRVSLNSLTQEDFKKILTEPENALTKQYTELLKTEGIEVSFSADGIEEIAKFAYEVNEKTENIGARRLHTILEKLLEEISFNAPDISPAKIVITRDFVREQIKDIAEDRDLSKYIL
ncbi:MAG: ATP-dependent protease ATPase subunit HslU [Proteobacteria bacterium]|nr:ATP-dependent protease ATPase subunit HslU [Pseudomonadota bacterium]